MRVSVCVCVSVAMLVDLSIRDADGDVEVRCEVTPQNDLGKSARLHDAGAGSFLLDYHRANSYLYEFQDFRKKYFLK